LKQAHRKATDCRNKALPLLDPPGERVAIPYEGRYLYANLRKPRGASAPPVVVMCMGLDSAKEEVGDYEERFLKRGLATLAFDGPGQGEGEYDFAICPEYEKPVKAVIDFVRTRKDLDAGRVGIWGVSLGGYYAPRAAAFDRRILACVALSGPYQRSASFAGRPEMNVEAFRVRSKSANLEEAGKVALRFSLKGIARNITCPIYIVAGTKDRLTPVDGAKQLAAEVSGPCVLSIIEGGNHVVNNLWYRSRDQTADGWRPSSARPDAECSPSGTRRTAPRVRSCGSGSSPTRFPAEVKCACACTPRQSIPRTSRRAPATGR
jgi:2,6-dihydroxypseudooxynicotine hydrolase